MEVNNELRRLNIKLKVLDTEGVGWMIHDFLKLATKDEKQWTSTGEQWLIDTLRRQYQKEIQDLTPDTGKQQKLFT